MIFTGSNAPAPTDRVVYDIPIYMPNLNASSCGHPQWGAAADRGYEIERRERWPETGNSASTTAFVSEVMASERLTGIFVGHYHRATAMSFNNQHQYISGSAFSGEYRLIRFLYASILL